ncbi:phage tail protein [Cupriavidus sp.]|uniref:phage tail protein n=1 Tax=Cupriavidus sp. TaxID=1873897 RepID=UPI0025C0D8C6|nr:phage tail protein [Cupriavidus sp.]MCA3184633.1 tail fiber protein [Cupriavidus sp.]MCA3199769.1 tail fiber protein [Cupriavidus sp.]
MSQHDMDVANQAGAAFRADMNDALKALASVSSGASAPATTFPCQLWADTNANLLKMRNVANNAWITVGQLGVANLGHLLPGTVVYHAKNTAPGGFIKCNGGAVSRTTYADLFAEIGTTFGAGDGSTTFNLPELRGEFVRGWDDSRGIDASRVFASAQIDALLDHAHAASGGAFMLTDGGNNVQSGSGKLNISGSNNLTTGALSLAGGGTRTASENRPRNVALLACIKY